MHPALTAFLTGCSASALIAAVHVCSLPEYQDRHNLVPRDEYYRKCHEMETLSVLYLNERIRHVHLVGDHAVAQRVVK